MVKRRVKVHISVPQTSKKHAPSLYHRYFRHAIPGHTVFPAIDHFEGNIHFQQMIRYKGVILRKEWKIINRFLVSGLQVLHRGSLKKDRVLEVDSAFERQGWRG